MTTTRAFALALTAASMGAIACGLGHSDSLDGGASSTAGNGGNGGDDASSSGACPTTEPAADSPCTTAPPVCEYGTSPNRDCNVSVVCDRGEWRYGKNDCIQKPQDPSCPSTYAQVAAGSSCATTGAQCNYSDGRCQCGVEQAGPIFADASGHTVWLCDKPTDPACPFPRPRLGSACATSASLVCGYGTCSDLNGISQSCVNGAWQETATACPL
jgi:hypothetical protein